MALMLSEKGLRPTDAQTLEEGFDLMRALADEVSKRRDEVKRNSRELVELRFCQGVLVGHMMDMPRGDHYGEGLMNELANYTLVGVSTLYKARKVAEHPEFRGSLSRFQAWAAEREKEKGGRLTWSYVINWTQKHLPEGEEEAQDELKEQTNSLLEKARREEERAQDLETEAEDLRAEVKRHNDQSSKARAEEVATQAEGVAAKTREVAEDLRKQAGGMEVKGVGRIESEAYLDHVRSHPCVACQKPEADAHHIVTGGTGTKGHDLLTIPLCREHHNQWHDRGKHTFCREYDIRPFQETTYLLMAFITGADYEALI
jgi:hypothetical protein